MTPAKVLSGVAIALALLHSTRSFGQCGWGISVSTVSCNSKSGVKTISSYTCQLYGNYRQGNPQQYCSENAAYCQQVDGTEVQ